MSRGCRVCCSYVEPPNRGYCSVRCRLLSKVDRTPGLGPNGDCWEWTGGGSRGYGQIRIEQKMRYAHQVSYEIFIGRLPKRSAHHDVCVCHTCDNTRCVNPDHLFIGSQTENVQDMIGKERQAKGEMKPAAKLTCASVEQIRTSYKSGGVTQTDLASQFGVHPSQISRIINHKAWEGSA